MALGEVDSVPDGDQAVCVAVLEGLPVIVELAAEVAEFAPLFELVG